MTLTPKGWVRADQLTFRIHPSVTERLDVLATQRRLSRAACIRALVEEAVAGVGAEAMPISITEVGP